MRGHSEVKEKGIEIYMFNSFWNDYFNVILNFYIVNVIIDQIDPLKGLLYYFKPKRINIVIKRDGNTILKKFIYICNEKSTELVLDGSNAAFGEAKQFLHANQI